MGWNSWNTFGCDINEGIVRAQADAMASNTTTGATGASLRDLGYEFVVVDDCWMAPRRNPATGELEADPERFPSGIAALASYVHARGLKFGLYSSPGPQTCAGRPFHYSSLAGRLPSAFPSFPGSEGHSEQDAATFASWGVDFLKYDRCTSPAGAESSRRFAAMRDSLAATGRPIVYSINPDDSGVDAQTRLENKVAMINDSKGKGQPTTTTKTTKWRDIAHMWRTTRDVDPVWAQMPWSQGFWSTGIVDAIDANGRLFADGSRPGRWNDPDMLQVGVRKPTPQLLWGSDSDSKKRKRQLALTDVEGMTQFSMWAMMAAPLILGNDLTGMRSDEATRATLTNAEVIAVDQDPLGVQGRRLASTRRDHEVAGGALSKTTEVWTKPLVGGALAVALFNRGESPQVIGVEWSAVVAGGQLPAGARVRARDLWRHTDVGEFEVEGGSYSAEVEAHGVVVLRVEVVQ